MPWTWKLPSARSTPVDYCGADSLDSRIPNVSAASMEACNSSSLTPSTVWLSSCRHASAGKIVIEGLILFVPANTSALICERMAHLHCGAAKWELYELDEREDDLQQIEANDRGNVLTRLVRCPDDEEIFGRFGRTIALVRSMMAEAEIGVLSPAEISFRCHGLEFARSRLSA